MNNLSERQQEIYDLIIVLKKKYPQNNPTSRQLAESFNMTKQAMNTHLIRMELKGKIKRLRGIEIVQ